MYYIGNVAGVDSKKLEEKIKQWIGEGEDSDCGVKGHVSTYV